METVAKAIKSLMTEELYYGLFALTLNKEFTDKLPTAGVRLNGINVELMLNKEFWYSLNLTQQKGLIKHELMHICLEHYNMGKDFPDHYRANVAMDLEINSYIGKSNLPPNGQFVEDYKLEARKGTVYYYGQLRKKFPPQPQGGGGDGQGGSDGDNPFKNLPSFDDHSEFFKEMEKLTETQRELVKKQVEFQMKEVAKQVQKSRGTIPGELQETIGRLFKIQKPVFNWKAYFRRLLGVNFDIYQKKTRRKESNRFEDCPGLRKKKKHKLLVAIDTSGSVCEEEFYDFFSEIHHIHKAGADIHILECDAAITNEYDYNGTMPKKITGRGGTSFLPCVEWYNKHSKDYTAMVYFTDGYGDQAQCKPNKKMIWIITSNGYQQDDHFPGIKVCIPKKEIE